MQLLSSLLLPCPLTASCIAKLSPDQPQISKFTSETAFSLVKQTQTAETLSGFQGIVTFIGLGFLRTRWEKKSSLAASKYLIYISLSDSLDMTRNGNWKNYLLCWKMQLEDGTQNINHVPHLMNDMKQLSRGVSVTHTLVWPVPLSIIFGRCQGQCSSMPEEWAPLTAGLWHKWVPGDSRGRCTEEYPALAEQAQSSAFLAPGLWSLPSQQSVNSSCAGTSPCIPFRWLRQITSVLAWLVSLNPRYLCVLQHCGALGQD